MLRPNVLNAEAGRWSRNRAVDVVSRAGSIPVADRQEAITEGRFCVACLHHMSVPDEKGTKMEYCVRTMPRRSCFGERMEDGRCGSEGLFFQRSPN